MPEPRFNDDARGNGGHFSTQSIVLASVLNGLDFAMRGTRPVSFTVSGNRLIRFVDKRTGRIEDLIRVVFHFDYATRHKMFGNLQASQIKAIHDKYYLERDISEGKHINVNAANGIEARYLNYTRGNPTLDAVVRVAIDTAESFVVIGAVCEDLKGQPDIDTACAIKRGVIHKVTPLNCEPLVQRQAEKFTKEIMNR